MAKFFALDYSGLPNSGKGDVASQGWQDALNIAFGVAASLAVLMIIIAGLRYILASGDPGKVAQARKGIIYSTVGLLVVLAAYSIVTLILRSVS